MSIRDKHGGELVRLPGLWEVLAKFAFAASVPVLLLGMSWAVWVTNRVWENTADIRMLKDRGMRGGVSQSVNVGAVETVADTDSAREYLTVQEVAEREGVTDRTVINWIEEGRIVPAPEKAGKSWAISESFRILPHVAEAGRGGVIGDQTGRF